ncbi:histidine phosphatase family protein [Effusibacillus consociatus]|uniref:Histidine phosphatase family protein n=1 Tax=Effusibacillus consociatus TaxID=1117041 RepID=A0ABV9PW68_9BACL
MTRIILVRHGITDHNLEYRLSGWTDAPLNEVGVQQAECVADRLEQLVREDNQVDGIYASPLQRAAQTAEIIANRLGLSVTCRDELKEMNFGVYDGVPITELYETHKEMVDRALNPGDDEFGWEGGETRAELYHRIEQAIRRIADNHPEQTVVIVTHAGAIAYFITGLLDKPLSHWNEYHVANCSLTTVLWKDGRFELETHNETSHVPKEKFAQLIEEAKNRLGMKAV